MFKNVHVAANEYKGELIFLHKVKDGAVDDSYGIQVAKLADLPDEVIQRAQVILNDFEQKSDSPEPQIVQSESYQIEEAKAPNKRHIKTSMKRKKRHSNKRHLTYLNRNLNKVRLKHTLSH